MSPSVSFLGFTRRAVRGSSQGPHAGSGVLIAITALGRFHNVVSFGSLGCAFLGSFSIFLQGGKLRIGAVNGRVEMLHALIGRTVGRKCVPRSTCPFHGFGVGGRRARRHFLLPGRLRGVRSLGLPRGGGGDRRILSTFLFYYCAKLEFSSFGRLDGHGLVVVSKGD